MGVILKENNIIYTYQKHDKFLGSSRWRYDTESNTLLHKVRDREKEVRKEIKEIENFPTLEAEQYQVSLLLRMKQSNDNEAILESSLQEKKSRKKKETYILNKKKVREKCTAFFGLRQSRKFLAFYSISFPVGMSDNDIMKCYNTYLTRCRKDVKLRSYLWVGERQKNGTLHFHMLTNNYMPIRQINYYMAKAIENVIKRYKLPIKFDTVKYNGVDVKRCENNKKRLCQYLTKYISKNNIAFFRLPYHSSRDISELFTAETFSSEKSKEFQYIKNALEHITTYVVDNEYFTIEYLSQKQDNGKFFNPPDAWYWFLNHVNEQIYNNFHAVTQFDKLPLKTDNVQSKN